MNYVGREVESDYETDHCQGEAADAQLLNVNAKLAAHLEAHLRVMPAFSDPAAELVYFGTALGQASPDLLGRVNASSTTSGRTRIAIVRPGENRRGINRSEPHTD